MVTVQTAAMSLLASLPSAESSRATRMPATEALRKSQQLGELSNTLWGIVVT